MSKPLDKNFSLNYELDQLPGCCGIWEVTQFYWDGNNGWFDGEGLEYPARQGRFNSEAKRVKREVLHTGKAAICTLIDQSESDRMLLKAFLNAGWREDRKVKSNHGNYFIYLLSIQRRRASAA